MKIVVIGGGAAGFFSALTAKESNPDAKILLIERSVKLLSKVRISGGGRCNVTHACFDPKLLVQNYPRGKKELLGPFSRFQPKDTVAWFQARGVKLKKEKDGRMFPNTDSSDTIINCFLKEAKQLKVDILTQTKLASIEKKQSKFHLLIKNGSPILADRVILATGSSPVGWEIAKNLGHKINTPIPSLFTFNIPSFQLAPLAGVSVDRVKVSLKNSKLGQTGPLLITHWGFSGPAALKLSAFGARFLAENNYKSELVIDWLPDVSLNELQNQIEFECTSHPKKHLKNLQIPLPKSLLKELYLRANLQNDSFLRLISKKDITRLLEVLKQDVYEVIGKTTNKEEFVTCGGIKLSEVNFKTMESKLCEDLFFCGEILDIDGVTGGFNFQNAWTTGWIAGKSASSNKIDLLQK